MNIQQRKNDFISLGNILEQVLRGDLDESAKYNVQKSTLEELQDRIEKSYQYNAWFTPDSIKSALNGIVHMLKEDSLNEWISRYPDLLKEKTPHNVGIVMAGNIPLVGFHDFLCVLLSGNIAVCKLSSSDNRLWPTIIQILSEIDLELKDQIKLVLKLEKIDAVIATGSNNTSRYFEYYFGKYPHIIRKNRNAVAVLTGEESKEQLEDLANDVFAYFGLGCRNVSKLFLPEDMDLNRVIEAFYEHKELINHNKYANNYDYNKTVMLLNQDDLLENGFLLFKKSEEIASPLATLYYERYSNYTKLIDDLGEKEDEIQCIVGSDHVDFGKAQLPDLWDYADGVDTMDFLISLN